MSQPPVTMDELKTALQADDMKYAEEIADRAGIDLDA